MMKLIPETASKYKKIQKVLGNLNLNLSNSL